MLVLNPGDLDVDVISLMPENTYMGHGIRKDLAQALADLHPKFMRFPGGCVGRVAGYHLRGHLCDAPHRA